MINKRQLSLQLDLGLLGIQSANFPRTTMAEIPP